MGAVGSYLASINERAKQTGARPPKLQIAPVKTVPRRFEFDYQRAIMPIVIRTVEAVRDRLVPRIPEWHRRAVPRADVRQDVEPVATEIDTILGSIQTDLDIIGQARDAARSTASAVNFRNAANIRDQVGTVLRQELLMNDERARDVIENFVRDNVDLIQTIPQGHLSRVRNSIVRGLNGGQTVEQISAEIARITRATTNQAKTIARDQVQKLNGTLTRHRQVDLGITHYIWRTMGDDRVRPAHARRDGRRFSWDRPPIDGHPGQAVNCRCVALPDIAGEAERR